ncbi:type IV pilin [Natrarchaeobaculum sulfurireducens]|nr:type IV pilin N-terminal domain-containing protein [Natrarchaeobaculum sulfurireducens]
MLDGKQLSKKLIGSEEERAVSPVIGVILMVAITVILAAVIAAFVLDLGGSVGEEAQAGVSIDVDEGEDQVTVEVTSMGNADYVTLGGSVDDEKPASYSGDYLDDRDDEANNASMTVGDTITLEHDDSGLDSESGTVTAVAVIEDDGTTTQVGSEDYDFSN